MAVPGTANWYAIRDSNPELAGYKPDTLTVELMAHLSRQALAPLNEVPPAGSICIDFFLKLVHDVGKDLHIVFILAVAISHIFKF